VRRRPVAAAFCQCAGALYRHSVGRRRRRHAPAAAPTTTTPPPPPPTTPYQSAATATAATTAAAAAAVGLRGHQLFRGARYRRRFVDAAVDRSRFVRTTIIDRCRRDVRRWQK